MRHLPHGKLVSRVGKECPTKEVVKLNEFGSSLAATKNQPLGHKQLVRAVGPEVPERPRRRNSSRKVESADDPVQRFRGLPLQARRSEVYAAGADRKFSAELRSLRLAARVAVSLNLYQILTSSLHLR